jgi:hypothetical protein
VNLFGEFGVSIFNENKFDANSDQSLTLRRTRLRDREALTRHIAIDS